MNRSTRLQVPNSLWNTKFAASAKVCAREPLYTPLATARQGKNARKLDSKISPSCSKVALGHNKRKLCSVITTGTRSDAAAQITAGVALENRLWT